MFGRTHRHSLRSVMTDDRGSVFVLFGLIAVAVVVTIGAAIDFSNLTRSKAELQAVADAAALAGARALGASNGQPDGARIAAAVTAAQGYVDAKSPEAQRTVTPSISDSKVTVVLSATKRLAFAKILAEDRSTIGAAAAAVYSLQTTPCFVALGSAEPTGIGMTGAPRITAPKCGVMSNSRGTASIDSNGNPRITARRVCAAGGADKAHGRIEPPAESGCSPAPDPFVGAIPAETGTCSPPPPVGQKVLTLGPGVYCGGLSFGNSEVALLPGLYEFRDGPLSIEGNGSLTGIGVSLLFRGTNATLQLQGSPKIALTAMSTGPLAGIVIAAAPGPTPLESVLQGSPDLALTGSVYLPNQRLKLQGNPKLTLLGLHDKIAALSYSLRGSPDIVVQADDATDASKTVADLRLVR